MKKNLCFIGIFGLCLLLFAGCGPSEAEIATMTADAWTPTPPPTSTPVPTPTPTPVPYGLTVSIVEEDETPIVGAQIALAEVEGENGVQTADEAGMASWFNLPGETVTLAVSAQGYFPSELSETIERGSNQLTITLQRDPHGILPSEACAPGENLLYIEDFQDGEAQQWPQVELRANGWDVIPDPDALENEIMFKPVGSGGGAAYVGSFFENAVWRIKFMPVGQLIFAYNWHWHNQYESDGETVDWSAYQIWFHPPAIRVFRAQPPLSTVTLHEVERVMESGVWHDIEMSYFEGTVEFWIDGVRFLSYEDQNPWGRGGITIHVGLDEPLDPEAVIYFDDAVVCELTAPFAPMPAGGPTASITTPIPADQSRIMLGSYQIEINSATVWAEMAIREGEISEGANGMLFFPVTPNASANTLIVIMNLRGGDLESFTSYACEVVEPDGNRIGIENIQENSGKIFWLVPVSSTDTNLVVSCPDGDQIDLAPVLTAN